MSPATFVLVGLSSTSLRLPSGLTQHGAPEAETRPRCPPGPLPSRASARGLNPLGGLHARHAGHYYHTAPIQQRLSSQQSVGTAVCSVHVDLQYGFGIWSFLCDKIHVSDSEHVLKTKDDELRLRSPKQGPALDGIFSFPTHPPRLHLRLLEI